MHEDNLLTASFFESLNLQNTLFSFLNIFKLLTISYFRQTKLKEIIPFVTASMEIYHGNISFHLVSNAFL